MLQGLGFRENKRIQTNWYVTYTKDSQQMIHLTNILRINQSMVRKKFHYTY